MTPDKVTLRYRRVSHEPEYTRADAGWVSGLKLATPDGRTVPATLSDEFSVWSLSDLTYEDDGWVESGRIVYRTQPDGSVVREPEMVPGVVERTVSRYSGMNYVEFEGDDLVGPDSEWIKLLFPTGLLGGGAEWTFVFDASVTPRDAAIADSAEPASPMD